MQIVGLRLKRVQAIDHLAHQAAHLLGPDAGRLRPGNSSTVRVDHRDIGEVSGVALRGSPSQSSPLSYREAESGPLRSEVRSAGGCLPPPGNPSNPEKPMRIYARDQVCPFRFTRAPFGAFSNFQPLAVPIAAGPWSFSSSEAAYQAAKFGNRPDIQQRIFGSLTLRLPLRPDFSRETLATDGHEIRYSPRWVAETDSHLIETAMARVVMACALKHHTRRGERDPERWQMASQLVTHALIRDAGFTLPPDAEAWDGLTVEQAYDRLQADDGDPGGDGDAPSDAAGAGASPDGQPSPDGDDEDSDEQTDFADDSDGQDEDGDTDGDGEPDGKAGDGPDGDCQDQAGNDEDGEGDQGTSDAPPSHDPSGTGEVMDADARAGDDGEPAEAPVDVNAEEQAWDEAMHQALNIARAEGNPIAVFEEETMNKADLISHVAAETSVTRATAERMVGAVFSAIGDALARGEPVAIAGFGKFATRSRAARRGRNPQTGETIAIAASKAPSFKAAKALRDAVNA